jgi:hypothetical protein
MAGGYGAGDPPDPIPNSEVKTRCADGTAGATRWESTAPPAFFMTNARFDLRIGAGVWRIRRFPGMLGSWRGRSAPLPDPPPQTAWGRETARESAVAARSSPPLPYRAGTRGCRPVVYGRGGRGVRALPEAGGPEPLPFA